MGFRAVYAEVAVTSVTLGKFILTTWFADCFAALSAFN
jgi:hypothetical protein